MYHYGLFLNLDFNFHSMAFTFLTIFDCKNIMILRLTFTIGYFFIFITTTFTQSKYTYYDGPYLEVMGDSITELWIENGALNKSKIPFSLPYHFEKEGLPEVTINKIIPEANPFERYTGVEKFVAISDIHGQHQLFIKLLKEHNVIDSTEAWIYGDGHLVIVGDVMDRGPQVTESLWFLYKLEKEAEAAGGKVHVLLGNHELMVMHGDIGYVNAKYRYTSGISQIKYPDFFNDRTILGQWLRSKNLVTVINEYGFVHGGFSEKVINKESSLSTLNALFKTEIVPKGQLEYDTTNLLSMLYFDNGPLWYRGYANPEGFDETTANNILDALDIESIVVGHTSMPQIVSIHDNKILLIDSSIKFGKSGEMLVYENDSLYRAKDDGSRVSIDAISPEDERSSPFQYVYDFGDMDLTIKLDTDLGKLMYKNKMEEVYQPATMFALHNGLLNRKWNVRLKTRGNMRKKVSKFPPLKIDFSKTTLNYLGFTRNDKLKLVLPARDNKSYQQRLYREHVIYNLYHQVDTLGMRTHLVNVILQEKGKEKFYMTGFFIEDENDFTSRTNTDIIESGVIRSVSLEREHYVKMVFFQYMILNTDFSVGNNHNLEMVSIPGDKQPRAIPYDFDYSGMVDQDYAVPFDRLPIYSVRDYYFKGIDITREEVEMAVEFYKPLKKTFKQIIDDAKYLNRKSKKSMKKDIDEFYKRLEEEDKWEKRFLNPLPMLKTPR